MNWIKPELVLLDLKADDSQAVIEALGNLLYHYGYVKETYVQAVIDREKVFATGLPTPEIKVAIPHTDVDHVMKNGIAVGLLSKPVTFGEMGNPDRSVDVEVVCCLAVKQSESLVSLLQNLVAMIQDSDFLRQLLTEKSANKVANIINNRLPNYQED